MNDSLATRQIHSTSQTELLIDGMHCGHCTETVRKILRSIDINDVTIDLTSSSALLCLGEKTTQEVIDVLTRAGYPARLPSARVSTSPIQLGSLEAKLLISAIFTAPLLLHMFSNNPLLHNEHVQGALALPVVVIGLTHFGKSAWRALRQRIANMDLLIFVGIAAAFFYSLYGTISGLGDNFLFYETAASITLFVLFGSYLERRSMAKTSAAVEELARLQPQRALRVLGDQSLEEIDVSAIQRGDTLLVRTGDKVPVDGTIVQGEALLNESFISGESLPHERLVGEPVIGGAIIERGSVQISALAIGEETTLSQIIRLVRTATSQKPAIQKLGDRVSSVFVPVVFAISILTFIIAFFFCAVSFEQALLQSIAVLVISCPCAMGLATPTAVTVGIGRSAREGALIKGGAALERLAHIDTVIFDKTGTLTDGELDIDQISLVSGERSVALGIIKTIEASSTHPLAQTVSRALGDQPHQQLVDISEEKGLGMIARDADGASYKLGSARFTGHQVGNSTLYLTKNDQLLAHLSVKDKLRPGATAVVKALFESGIKVVIISGDQKDKVAAAAQQLGVTEYYFEQLPAEKLVLTAKLSESGNTCFIGDGINDAPALAQASVGISLSGATQVAIQTADVILLDGKLERLPSLLSLARLTFATIKENLFWAFFYNSMAIPLAAFGFLTPLIGALAMAFSDVIVIGNSLRLKYRKS